MDLKEKLIASHPAFQESLADDALKTRRQSALKTFAEKGFPTKKEEAWKYTSLKPVLNHDYSLTAQAQANISSEDYNEFLVEGLNAYNLIFVDGVYQPQLSSPSEGKFVVCALSEALQNEVYSPVIKQHLGQIAPQNDSLSALNNAFTQEGSFIYLKANQTAEKTVQLLYLSTGSEAALFTQPHNLVVAEENAHLKVIERHQSLTDNPVLTNTLTEIAADKYAVVDYYKIQNDRHTASLIDNTYLTQKGNSETFVHTFSFGGKLTRNNVRAAQQGEYINSTLKGVTILEDKQHVDHNTFVHHMQPNCESHQDYKGVFDDQSHGVFDGYILVDDIAQKTDGYQKSDNLLLSDRATAHAKPQLEIYADDVKCSHGCTIGQMDKEALFYLKQRGIPEKEARALMMFAFSGKVLDSVKIPELKQRINKLIALKLGVNIDLDD